MLPVLRLWGYSLSTYVLMTALACAVFWVLFARDLKKDVPVPMRILLPPLVAVSALIGARLLHAALNPGRYGPEYPVWSLRCERFCLMGGLILGMLVLYAVCHELELPFFRVSDDLTTGAGAALAILKAGCFLNGCCTGKPTTSVFGVVFPAREALYDLLNTPPEARRLWPVQLFECIAYLLGIAVLLIVANKKKLPEGTRFLSYAAYVSAIRLCLHPLRELTVTAAKIFYPVLYLILLIVSGCLLIRQIRRETKERGPSPAS
ncbi:MAG: prolipoprotein diacylglyceryl transferase [Clostridia bacterium]|nr:prolipoprotein diacylglyceryl transferase [Clostridia bacterium]